MMKMIHKISLFLALLLSINAKAQIAANYSVGTWSHFKTAAISYTFDDNCGNQIPVALPLFDQYGYKVTFFTVTGSMSPNWNSLKSAATNGHEIASHTVTHANVTTTGTASDNELKNSQSTINANITTAKCVTFAYPNCNVGDLATLQSLYIAARICNGQIESKTPSNFYQLGSIITGNTGSITSAASFNSKVASAKSSGGWCSFLTHGIDGDGGYSPTQSAELKSHLSYMNTNAADFWIATFGNVVKYIKERNAASLTETTITSDSLKVVLSHNLDNTIYNVPITIRRTLPTGWQTPKVYLSGKLSTSSLVTSGATTYIQFDAVPNQGTIFLANGKKTVTGLEDSDELISVAIEPNPFWQETVIRYKGEFSYSVSSTEGKLIESGKGIDLLRIGNYFSPGVYIISVMQDSKVHTLKIVKN